MAVFHVFVNCTNGIKWRNVTDMQVSKRSGPVIDISGTPFKVFAKSLNRKIYFGSLGFFSNSWKATNIYKLSQFFDNEYPTFESIEVCMEAEFKFRGDLLKEWL